MRLLKHILASGGFHFIGGRIHGFSPGGLQTRSEQSVLEGVGICFMQCWEGSVRRQCRPAGPHKGFPTAWASGPVAVTDTIGTTIATLSSKITFLELFIL